MSKGRLKAEVSDHSLESRSPLLPTVFAIHARPSRERLVLAADGDIDIATSAELLTAALDAVDDGWRKLVIDLRGVSFMDSAGAHLLLSLRDLRSRGIETEVVLGDPDAMVVLQHLELGDVLPCVDGHELDLVSWR